MGGGGGIGGNKQLQLQITGKKNHKSRPAAVILHSKQMHFKYGKLGIDHVY